MKSGAISIIWIFIPIATSFCVFLFGCGSSVAARRSLTKQLMNVSKETADLLATVKDKGTAEGAAPKLKALLERADKLTEQLDAMDSEDGSSGTDEELLNELASWIAEHGRMMQEEQRISQIPEACAGLGETWQMLTGGAYDKGGVFAPGGVMDLQRGKQP
jgi:hypothetical protein